MLRLPFPAAAWDLGPVSTRTAWELHRLVPHPNLPHGLDVGCDLIHHHRTGSNQ